MTFHATLEDALQDIANRSFDESALVTPTDNGYLVENDWNTCIADDVVMWTYNGGLELPRNISDHSPLHEPCEFYDSSEHVRYNLSNAVADLESGLPVAFTYLVVSTYPECERDECWDECECDFSDLTTGWILASRTLD